MGAAVCWMRRRSLRASSLVGFSSEEKSPEERSSVTAWQKLQRTFMVIAICFMRPTSWGLVMLGGRTCRLVNLSGMLGAGCWAAR